ncbi:hypothetical protein ACVOMV_05445 [Mesorhizobium atlanticum]
MADTITLTDHDEIRLLGGGARRLPGHRRRLAGGWNASHAAAGFGQQAYEDTLTVLNVRSTAGGYELVEWDEWFRIFDERQLALSRRRRRARPARGVSRDHSQIDR